jgi:SAM-dependent methyltransferase
MTAPTLWNRYIVRQRVTRRWIRPETVRRNAKQPRLRTRTEKFGAAYFRKFYLSSATRVVSAAEMRTRARLIAAILAQASIPVRSVLDAGCGIGLLRKPFTEVWPRVRYAGLDASEYLCARYGWILGSVVDYTPRAPSDLLVCYDVLQYLDDRCAARALANFGRLTRSALYFSALTREDWRDNCDRRLTDRAVHLRPGEWYRRRLRRQFFYLGFGTWLRKGEHPLLWDLERSTG